MDEDKLLSVAQLAGRLQVPEQTLYGWRYKGEGPRAIKVGRHLRYRRSDVEKWLEEHEDRESSENRRHS
jgi:excisionase family DNA binding protein